MSLRKTATDGLSARQKLALFHGTGLSAESALSTADMEITYDLMVANGVKALNISCAGIRPMALKAHGVVSAAQLRRLGFDALHLVDPVMATEANAAYGATDVIAAFLVAPQDAVALAGSAAMGTLNLSVQQLLEVCAGAPTEAVEVLKQVQTTGSPLRGVKATTLLDTGMRAQQLKQLGYGLPAMRELAELLPDHLRKLGFSL